MPSHAEGEDYKGKEFSAFFPAGETKASFNITIVDDNVFEPDEYFSLTLEIPQPALDIGVMGGDPCIANSTITSNDGGFSLMVYYSIYVHIWLLASVTITNDESDECSVLACSYLYTYSLTVLHSSINM